MGPTLGDAGLYCHLSGGLHDHSHHAFGQEVGQPGVDSATHSVVVQLVDRHLFTSVVYAYSWRAQYGTVKQT